LALQAHSRHERDARLHPSRRRRPRGRFQSCADRDQGLHYLIGLPLPQPRTEPHEGRRADPSAVLPAHAAPIVAVLLSAGALLLPLAASLASPNASGKSERERYLDLLHREKQLERLNAAYKLEADLSAKRTAYAVLSLSERRLYFKVRGRAFKGITMTGL